MNNPFINDTEFVQRYANQGKRLPAGTFYIRRFIRGSILGAGHKQTIIKYSRVKRLIVNGKEIN